MLSIIGSYICQSGSRSASEYCLTDGEPDEFVRSVELPADGGRKVAGGLVAAEAGDVHRLACGSTCEYDEKDAVDVGGELLDVVVPDGAVGNPEALFDVEVVVAFALVVQAPVECVSGMFGGGEYLVEHHAVMGFYLRPKFPVAVDGPGH
ncbi:hypothetical protein BCON_0004g00590 [Botryotinia convoluta]|uniref:Uncharacterized protein n=1 Tax=Botryotinia convoluta TaxID=54673 RepID=A0A4Z1J048_9HELO|nr:hypothetical protein BCON_0004g00590 [Botryotinia convoluta]